MAGRRPGKPKAGCEKRELLMNNQIARRDFLKTASAAGVFAHAAIMQGRALADAGRQPRRPGDVRISGTSYSPVAGYPIQPKRFSEVVIHDSFWKPRIRTNAEVTIPFQARK